MTKAQKTLNLRRIIRKKPLNQEKGGKVRIFEKNCQEETLNLTKFQKNC